MQLQKHLPIQHYCKQITELFQQSISQPDPALFLHRKDARTPLFMAESLMRVLEEVAHKKKTEKALKLFKKLEDALGRIEENDTIIKQFSKNKAIDKEALNYFMKKRIRAIDKLNEKLLKKEFYQDALNKINNGLTINLNGKAVVHQLQKQIEAELDYCARFFSEFENGFTDMETQVHELRRKLRWISMYPRSLQGVITLEADKTKYEWERRFNPPSSASSPFNKVTVNKNLTAHIKFNPKAFHALNFVVAELGKIKDKGLNLQALTKAIVKTSNLDHEAAGTMAMKQLKLKISEPGLLQEAHELLNDYFETYKIHKLLL